MITKLVPRIRSTDDSNDWKLAKHHIPIAIVDKMAKIRPIYLKINGNKHRSAYGTMKALATKGTELAGLRTQYFSESISIKT